MLRYMIVGILFASLCCLAASAEESNIHKWVSDKGHTTQASFVGSEYDKTKKVTIIILKKQSGQVVKVPVNRLGEDSKKLARRLIVQNRLQSRIAAAAAVKNKSAEDARREEERRKAEANTPEGKARKQHNDIILANVDRWLLTFPMHIGSKPFRREYQDAVNRLLEYAKACEFGDKERITLAFYRANLSNKEIEQALVTTSIGDTKWKIGFLEMTLLEIWTLGFMEKRKEMEEREKLLSTKEGKELKGLKGSGKKYKRKKGASKKKSRSKGKKRR